MIKTTLVRKAANFAQDETGSITFELGIFVAMAMIGAVSSADFVGGATQRLGEQVMFEGAFVVPTSRDGVAAVAR